MSILRMLFCGDHNQTLPKIKSYMEHFKTLWSNSTLQTKREVRDAFLGCSQSAIISSMVVSLAKFETSFQTTISCWRNAPPSRTPQPETLPRSPGYARTQYGRTPREKQNCLPENENKRPTLTPLSSPPSRPRTAQGKLGDSVQSTANLLPSAQAGTFSREKSHLDLERDSYPETRALSSLRSSSDHHYALDQQSTGGPTKDFSEALNHGSPLPDTNWSIVETQGKNFVHPRKFPISKKTAYKKNISISTPIPSLIAKGSFQASYFLSGTFNFAPPVPQFYTTQHRYGQKKHTEKSPFTRNDVDNVVATPMERINASAISSTIILKPEEPDTTRLENSTLNHVTKSILVQPLVESGPRESSSNTSLKSTISKPVVCKHTDHFSKTEPGDDRSTLPIRSKPATIIYHRGKMLRVKLPSKSINSATSSEEIPRSNEISAKANQPLVTVVNLTQSKAPESVHFRATSPSNQRTRKQACTYDVHTPNTIAKEVRTILLRGVEEQSEFIYVLKAPRFFETFQPAKEKGEEWVKIGISRNIKKRISSLKNNCGFTDLQECYGLGGGPVRIDLRRIIERVCHAELNNSRRTIQCTEGVNGARCDTLHNEWFAVSEEVAVWTVKRWRRFLDYEPMQRAVYCMITGVIGWLKTGIGVGLKTVFS